VFTDWPMFAFRAQLPIPPDLTVLSSKRLESGEITEAEIIRRLEQVRPEQVFTLRLKLPALEQYLEENYRVEWEWGNRRLYLLRE